MGRTCGGLHGERLTIRKLESEVEGRSDIVGTCTGLLDVFKKASDTRSL